MNVASMPQEYEAPGRVNFGWITESWQLFMANVGVWIGAMATFAALPIVLTVIFMAWMSVFLGPQASAPPPLPPGATVTSLRQLWTMAMPPQFAQTFQAELLLGLVMLLYSAYLYGGLFRMAVKQVRGEPVTFRELFSGGPLFGRMLGAMVLLGIGAYGLEALIGLPSILLAVFRPHDMGTIIVSLLLSFLVIMVLFLVLCGLLLPAFALMADGVGVFPALRRSIEAMKAQWLPATGFVFVLGLLIYASEIPCGLGLLATIPMAFLISALAYRDLAGMPNVIPPPALAFEPPRPGVWPPPPNAEMPPGGIP